MRADRGGVRGGVTFGRPFLSNNAKSLCLCPTFYIHVFIHFLFQYFLQIFLPSIVLGVEAAGKNNVDEAGLPVVLENVLPHPQDPEHHCGEDRYVNAKAQYRLPSPG